MTNKCLWFIIIHPLQEQFISGALTFCWVGSCSKPSGPAAHVCQPRPLGADQQSLRALSTIWVPSYAAPQVSSQLQLASTEPDQLCWLQGDLHSGGCQRPYLCHLSNCFFTGPDSPGTDRFAIVLKLLHPLLLVSTISPPACSSAKGSLESSWQPTLPLGGSGYYNMRNWIMAVYIWAPLSIVKMQSNIYFWGRPYKVPQCHWERNYIFTFLWRRKTIFKGRGRVLYLLSKPSCN